MVDEVVAGGWIEGEVELSEAAFGVGEGAIDEPVELVGGEGEEGEELAAGAEGAGDGEGGVLGGGADEGEETLLYVGQEGVLLALAEAVDLVEEKEAQDPISS